jgi:hypothetical protein
MIKRMTVEECKAYWFGDDLTICAMKSGGEFWGALPLREVLRGSKYLKELENCQTIEQAQAVYEQYVSDAEAPKLLPRRLINFLDEADQILEFLESAIEQKLPGYEFLVYEHIEQGSNLELYELIKNEMFSIYESQFYRDESNVNVIYGQASLITDTWVPIEVAKEIGEKDNGDGFFYETVEYVYPDFAKFSRAFIELGFVIVSDSQVTRDLGGY